MPRRQLAAVLLCEAVLLALAASVVGVLAGIGFGWLGVAALTRQADLHRALLVVPAGPILAVVGLAVAAATIASLPPARRAARAAPVQALADV